MGDKARAKRARATRACRSSRAPTGEATLERHPRARRRARVPGARQGRRGRRRARACASCARGRGAARGAGGGAARGAGGVRRRPRARRALPRARRATSRCRCSPTGTATCVHLGERECSLQRRHQKVVEEAPSPAVDADAARARWATAAVALARGVGYEGAGTVEFMSTPRRRGLLLPRDEHPAAGRAPGHRAGVRRRPRRGAAAHRGRGAAAARARRTFVPRGHAVEARVYAEDPAAGFLPSSGRIVRGYPSRRGGGSRRRGRAAGSRSAPHYDPMLAKVIAHGPDRPTALARLDRALASCAVARRRDERGLHPGAAGAGPDVRAGDMDTGLLERRLRRARDAPARRPAPGRRARRRRATRRRSTAPGRGGARSTGWARSRCATAGRRGGRTWAARRRVRRRTGALRVAARRRRAALRVAVDGDAVWVGRDGHPLEARPERAAPPRAAAGRGRCEAPMPGTVLLVHVADGEPVAEGDVLLVLESMKMELAITAPARGRRRAACASPPGTAWRCASRWSTSGRRLRFALESQSDHASGRRS